MQVFQQQQQSLWVQERQSGLCHLPENRESADAKCSTSSFTPPLIHPGHSPALPSGIGHAVGIHMPQRNGAKEAT